MARRPLSVLRGFLSSEAGGGAVLIAAAVLSLLVANLPTTSDGYARLLEARVGAMSVHRWIDDGLMALFFLLVGCEIKRELVDGGLSDPRRRRLPFVAAAAGMAVPAVIFLTVTGATPGLARGWAVPAATDIAFAVGVLALLGPRVPLALKVFLTAVAIVDDMGAVAIIALGYTDRIDAAALAAAAGVVAVLVVCNRCGERRLLPYLAGFVALWWLVLLSGVHPTVAGVLAAACVPVTRSPAKPDDRHSPLHRLEHALGPAIAYGVVPLFAFANAGLPLAGIRWASLAEPLTLGIAAGLFVGKPLGITGAIALAERSGFAARPGHASWRAVLGVAWLAGIGFTMSLFIGGLAFSGEAMRDAVRLGVFAGSLLSALAGVALLRMLPPSAGRSG